MNPILDLFKRLGKREAYELSVVGEIYRLTVAIDVIRRQLISGRYDGSYMCIAINRDPTLTDEEKELAIYVIEKQLITGNRTLVGHVMDRGFNYATMSSQEWEINTIVNELHEDYCFMTTAIICDDKFARRVVLSNWYFKQCRILEQHVRHLRRKIK